MLCSIVHTRASLFRRTLHIDYDPEQMDSDVWEELLSLHGHSERRADVPERPGVLVGRHKG